VSSKALFLSRLSLHRMLPPSSVPSAAPYDCALRRILLFAIPSLTALTQQTRARCKWARRIAHAKRHVWGWRTTPLTGPWGF
jgi:hypothetical protein